MYNEFKQLLIDSGIPLIIIDTELARININHPVTTLSLMNIYTEYWGKVLVTRDMSLSHHILTLKSITDHNLWIDYLKHNLMTSIVNYFNQEYQRL